MSKISKLAVHITLARLVQELGSSPFLVEGELRMHKICNINADHIQRQTKTDHLQLSLKRKAAIDAGLAPNRQINLTECIECQTAVSSVNEKMAIYLVQSFVSAKISLKRLDNPPLLHFIAANVEGGGDIPKANLLREHYIPEVYKIQQVKLYYLLANSKMALIVDETNYVSGCYVVNNLLQPLDDFPPDVYKAVYINTEFLAYVNNVSIA